MLFTADDLNPSLMVTGVASPSIFYSDVVGIGSINLSFKLASTKDETQTFNLKYWLKKGVGCQDGVWFDLTYLYKDLARFLSQNHLNTKYRGFWQETRNWLSCVETRNMIINAIAETPFKDEYCDSLHHKNQPYLSYTVLANKAPFLFQSQGRLKSTRLYCHEWMVEDFFFVWLQSKTCYPLVNWIKEELAKIDRSKLDED